MVIFYKVIICGSLKSIIGIKDVTGVNMEKIPLAGTTKPTVKKSG